MRGTSTLDALRRAVEDMAAAGSSLDDIASAIVESTAGVDRERRAALWLYARSCTERADDPVVGTTRIATDTGRVHASQRPSEPGPASRRGRSEMPYVRCPNCGLTTYATRNRSLASECPGCGEPLGTSPEDDGAAGVGSADRRPGAAIAGALALARHQLDMDIALLTQITDGQEVVREEAGDWPPIGSLRGGAVPVEDTFCNQFLAGRIPNVIADAASDERVRDLGMARDFGVGAWIGVALELSDAQLYMLCCLAREARPALGDAEVRFLAGLGETVRARLEAAPQA